MSLLLLDFDHEFLPFESLLHAYSYLLQLPLFLNKDYEALVKDEEDSFEDSSGEWLVLGQ